MTLPAPRSRAHQIECCGGQYHCTVCDWSWQSKPDTVCPGVPRYDWAGVSAELHSKTGLKKRKLQPGGPPRGCVMNVYDGSYWWLYDEREAQPYMPPKREPARRRPNQSQLQLLFMCYTHPREFYDDDIKALAAQCRSAGWLVHGKGDIEGMRTWWQITKRGVAELEHWMPELKDRIGYQVFLEKRDRRRGELLEALYHALLYLREPTYYRWFADAPPDVDQVLERVKRELGFSSHPAPRQRNEVITWARELVARSDWCVLDTETTGRSSDDEIVQIAVIAPDGTVLLDTLLRPSGPIPISATQIHHITDEMVASAPTFFDIAPRLREVLEGRRIATYNASFDRRLLSQTRERYSVAPLGVPVERWDCAMFQYAAFCGEWHDYFRDFRYQTLPGGDHSALGDAKATLALIREMAATKMAYVETLL